MPFRVVPSLPRLLLMAAVYAALAAAWLLLDSTNVLVDLAVIVALFFAGLLATGRADTDGMTAHDLGSRAPRHLQQLPRSGLVAPSLAATLVLAFARANEPLILLIPLAALGAFIGWRALSLAAFRRWGAA